MLYSNLLTLNLLVFNELYFCHVLNEFCYVPIPCKAIAAMRNLFIPCKAIAAMRNLFIPCKAVAVMRNLFIPCKAVAVMRNLSHSVQGDSRDAESF